MACFTCKEELAGGVTALHKDGVILLPSVVNPHDATLYHKAVNEICCLLDYKKTWICDTCIRRYYM